MPKNYDVTLRDKATTGHGIPCVLAATRSVIMLLSIPLFTGCSDVSISPASEDFYSAKAQAQICSEQPANINLYSKILFVIDTSGSNARTDPNKVLRHGSIQEFFQRQSSSINGKYMSWGLITFGAGNAISYIQDGNRYFSRNDQEMADAITQFQAAGDRDNTPYVVALNTAKLAIEEDLKLQEDVLPTYNIVFISDGVPDPPAQNPDSTIFALSSQISELVQGSVHLSTVYYGPENPAAVTRLTEMARLGKGRFLQVSNANPTIDIESLIQGRSASEPYLIKRFMVYNLTSTTCDDATIGADSDIDGLCDKDEEKYNEQFAHDPVRRDRMNNKKFSSADRNSFHPYLNDGIYYRYILNNEPLPLDCEDSSDEDFDLLNACEERYLNNVNPTGPTPAWTEKLIADGKTGNKQNFDSDGDGVLDFLEYTFFKNKSAALDFLNMVSVINGRTQESLVVNHQHPVNPSKSPSYRGNFRSTGTNNIGQNCYSYTQGELPLYNVRGVSAFQTSGYVDLAHEKNENIVLLYYIQTPEYAPHSKGFLRYSYQRLVAGKDDVKDLKIKSDSFDMVPVSE